jgi:hypothetical protein
VAQYNALAAARLGLADDSGGDDLAAHHRGGGGGGGGGARPAPRGGGGGRGGGRGAAKQRSNIKTSNFRGVAATDNGTWRARIRYGRYTVHLGRCVRGGGVSWHSGAGCLSARAAPPAPAGSAARRAHALALPPGHQVPG